MTAWRVPRMWDGGRCFIIGGGPSMPKQFDIPDDLVSKVRDRTDPTGPDAYSPYMRAIHQEHVIVVNDGYRLGTWPDICIFGDYGWYTVHRLNLSKWPGLKVHCCKGDIIDQADGVKYLSRDRDHKIGLSPNLHKVAWGFNTGSSAINLAVHTGVKQVILLGFDMHWPGGKSHWHRGHGNEHRPRPNYTKWILGLKVVAEIAQRMGIEILNMSQDSSITQFRKVSLEEVL